MLLTMLAVKSLVGEAALIYPRVDENVSSAEIPWHSKFRDQPVDICVLRRINFLCG
mgnify:FL=1